MKILFIAMLMANGAHARDIVVTHAWARATAPHQEVGVAYLAITSKRDDMLVGVDADAGGMAMLHATTELDGVSSMSDVDRIRLPAGVTVTLSPRGMHIMLMDLKHSLRAGEVVRLSLHFLHGGLVEVTAPVLPIGSTGPAR